jgi:hypothetical protein
VGHPTAHQAHSTPPLDEIIRREQDQVHRASPRPRNNAGSSARS